MIPRLDARGPSLLLVDDERLLLHAFARVVRAEHPAWEVVTAACAHDACEALQRRPFDAIVSDMAMPGMTGVALLQHVREHYPSTLRVVYSGAVETYAHHAEVRRADMVFIKPTLATEVIEALERLLRPAPAALTQAPPKVGYRT
jgi:YesN/AraC family two-component response regulator